MRVSAAILTGGKASRLSGIVKGLLVGIGDVPLIERLINELAIAGVHEVILSTNDPQHYARFGKPLIADLHTGVGPLGGIEASLEYLAQCCESVIFLPCDLPNISAIEIIASFEPTSPCPIASFSPGPRKTNTRCVRSFRLGNCPQYRPRSVLVITASAAFGANRRAITVALRTLRVFLNINTPMISIVGGRRAEQHPHQENLFHNPATALECQLAKD